MQVIGKMFDGTVLVKMPERLVELLAEMVGVAMAPPLVSHLNPGLCAAPAQPPAPAPAKPQPAAPAHKPAAKPKPAKPAAGGTFVCRQCKKEFERKPGEQRQCCSPECLAALKRAYALKKYYEYKERKKGKAAPEKPAAPAVSSEEFKNRRIAMIRAAAQKEV